MLRSESGCGQPGDDQALALLLAETHSHQKGAGQGWSCRLLALSFCVFFLFFFLQVLEGLAVCNVYSNDSKGHFLFFVPCCNYITVYVPLYLSLVECTNCKTLWIRVSTICPKCKCKCKSLSSQRLTSSIVDSAAHYCSSKTCMLITCRLTDFCDART